MNLADELGCTPLMIAVMFDDLECVEILLHAGAAVDTTETAEGVSLCALRLARSRDIIVRLLEAGADPAHADQRVLLGLQATTDEALATVTTEEFQRDYTRRFATTNPERMRVPFWEAMIQCGARAGVARSRLAGERGAWIAPTWSAERLGQSLTFLPDGRAIQIGGEHEDFYDDDFCIYNDVFVHEPDGSIAIYGYPEEVFPPTDFHTATLVDEFIYVVGRLGYGKDRVDGGTPVYRLHTRTLQMETLHPSGEAPGWIFEHRAAAMPPNEIRVWGGKVIRPGGNEMSSSSRVFVLDLERNCWRRES